MNVLFVGVFDSDGKSTNTSQLLAIKKLGHKVVGYNYRNKAMMVGNKQRDRHLCETIENRNFDLVIFSKCNVVNCEVFKKATKKTKTCLWFMDPLISYDNEMRLKTALVDYFCCDKKNVLEESNKINKNSYHVFEGFDSTKEKPRDLKKKYDVAFIGNLYGDRKQNLLKINSKVDVFSSVFGEEHSKVVSQTKINLNFCTSNGASDRVYKTLAAGGFLLTNDWKGREKIFEDKKDLVIFKDIEDLNSKINYYLKNIDEAEAISKQGMKTVQKFTRENWARRIIEIYENY